MLNTGHRTDVQAARLPVTQGDGERPSDAQLKLLYDSRLRMLNILKAHYGECTTPNLEPWTPTPHKPCGIRASCTAVGTLLGNSAWPSGAPACMLLLRAHAVHT